MNLAHELDAQADFEEAENQGSYRTRELMRQAAAQLRRQQWGVIADGEVEIAFADRDACHQHINDAVMNDVPGAATWVVRPIYIGTP